jgi:hypothetical protein
MKFKNLLFLTILFFTIQTVFTQETKLTDEITFEIEKIKYKGTTGGGQGWVVSPKGYKYLIIESTFYGKSGEKEEFPLFEMEFKTDKEEYKVRPYSDVGPEYVKDYYIKVKKKKKWKLHIVVDDDFQTGTLYFKDKQIANITVEKDAKIGTFKIVSE